MQLFIVDYSQRNTISSSQDLKKEKEKEKKKKRGNASQYCHPRNFICLITLLVLSTPPKSLPFLSCQIVHNTHKGIAFQIFKIP